MGCRSLANAICDTILLVVSLVPESRSAGEGPGLTSTLAVLPCPMAAQWQDTQPCMQWDRQPQDAAWEASREIEGLFLLDSNDDVFKPNRPNSASLILWNIQLL